MAESKLLCKAIDNGYGEAFFQSAESRGLTLSQTIENDQKYGKFEPANGRHFTYAVLNEDTEFTEKQVHKAVRFAYNKWKLYAKLPPLKRVGRDYKGDIDFRIEFRTVETDPDKELTENTIMYHYYPIRNPEHPLRGLCVVNKKFFFTSHGNSVDGTEFIRHGVNATPGNKYRTYDFDNVYCHELGHGLGFPHDTEPFSIMSTPYRFIAEMPSMRDQARIKAKYGHRHMRSWWLARWIRWLRIASDRR
jgi:hypothetical protein